MLSLSVCVVSYRNSTSNHNFVGSVRIFVVLYLIEILHQTTTLILAKKIYDMLYLIEILHQTTTENHSSFATLCCILSKFYIKPQPVEVFDFFRCCCILSKFYIKPQQGWRKSSSGSGCILSKFYIKPQPCKCSLSVLLVVSYRNSTSNHNRFEHVRIRVFVVSYRNSTSNHNLFSALVFRILVVSYRNSTSNHNFGELLKSAGSVVSYRNSTSNHNGFVAVIFDNALYLIEILHQTTTLSFV